MPSGASGGTDGDVRSSTPPPLTAAFHVSLVCIPTVPPPRAGNVAAIPHGRPETRRLGEQDTSSVKTHGRLQVFHQLGRQRDSS